MEERINSILKHYDLSSSQFADEIRVQRSSVSHVLTGRNKPGFDFIQKILTAFPEVSAEWLITGVGKMLKEDKGLATELSNEETIGSKEKKEIINDMGDRQGKDESKIPNNMQDTEKKKIEKIIIIYNDRSFDEYLPH